MKRNTAVNRPDSQSLITVSSTVKDTIAVINIKPIFTVVCFVDLL